MSDQLELFGSNDKPFDDITEECALQIQSFTQWCTKHGYKVVGGLFTTIHGQPAVQIFTSHHEDTEEAAAKRAIIILETLLGTLKGTITSEKGLSKTMSLLEN